MATPVYGPEVYGRPAYSDLLADQEVYGNGPLDEEEGGTQTSSFTANALRLRVGSGSFTAEANITATVPLTFSANAVFKVTVLVPVPTALSIRSFTWRSSYDGDPTYPWTPVAGRQMVMVKAHRSSGGGAPTGWTLVSTGTTVNTLAVYKRTATGTETTVITGEGSSAYAIFEVDTSDPLSITVVIDGSSHSSTSPHPTPAITPWQSRSALVIGLIGGEGDGPARSYTPGLGWTELLDAQTAFAGQPYTWIGYQIITPVSGSYTPSATPSVSTPYYSLSASISAAAPTGGLTADAAFLIGRTSSFTANAVIVPGFYTFTANAVRKRTSQAGSLTANATKRKTISGSFTANATKLKTLSGSFTANSEISTAATFFANAALVRTTSGSFTANAWLIRRTTGTFTADAYPIKRTTGTFTANAAKFKTLSSTRTINAVKRTTLSSSRTIDAVLKARSFTASANIRASVTVTFTADARKAIGGSFTVNANLRKTRTGSFTANATKSRRIFVDTFTRTTAPLEYLGPPWSWVPFDSISGYAAEVKAYTDGSSIVLPNQSATFWYDSYAGFPLPSRGDLYFDFEIPTWDESDNTPVYGFHLERSISSLGIFVNVVDAVDWGIGESQYHNDYVFTPTPGDWWRVHVRWNGTTIKARTWNRSGSEPLAWGFEATQTFTAYSHATGIVPYLDLYYFPQIGDGRIDNVEVWTSVPTWFGFGGFQAEAQIVARHEFTANAVIGQSPTRTVIARAAIWKAQTGSFTANATFTSDGRVYGSFTADSNFFAPGQAYFTANANFVAVSERDPGRGQGPGGGNAGGGGGGGQGRDLNVFIRWDGIDITDHVKFDMTKFISSVSGRPGEAELIVVDPDQIFDFTSNKTLTLDIGGRRVWAGWATTVIATYAFDVDDTTDYDETTRWWLLSGPDVNVLFAKRVVYDKVDPSNGELHKFDVDTTDGTIIRYVVRHYTDLEADGITLNLSNVGTPVPDKRGPGGAVPGRTFGEFIYYVSQLSGGICYIDPTMVLHYEDDDTEDAPFRLSDRPAGRSNYAGVAGFRMMSSGSQLINDAQIWGAGQGKSTMTYGRVENDTSINRHGRWQEGELRGDLYKQASVNRVTRSFVTGSPQNLRGHKDDQPIYRARVYRDGLTAGMKVRVESEVFGVEEIIPIRMMTVTFPTPYDPVYELEMSHELDAILSISEWPPPLRTSPGGGGGDGLPGGDGDPWDTDDEEPGGCSDEVCGITDTLQRDVPDGWGMSDYGPTWVSDLGPLAEARVVDDYAVLVSYTVGGSAQVDLPFTISDTFDLTFEFQQFTGLGLDGWWAFLITTTSGYQFHVNLDGVGTGYIQANGEAHSFIAGFSPVIGTWYTCRFARDATTLYAKFWESGTSEPDDWTTTSSADFPFAFVGVDGGAQFYADGLDQDVEVRFRNLDIEGINRCTAVQFDDFNRTVVGGWGATTSGMTWLPTDTSLSVDGSSAVRTIPVSPSTPNLLTSYVVVPAGESAPWNTGSVFTMRTAWKTSSVVSTGNAYGTINWQFYRDSDGGLTRFGLQIDNTGGNIYGRGGSGVPGEFELDKNDWLANTWYEVKIEFDPGNYMKFKMWVRGETEPVDWTGEISDVGFDPITIASESEFLVNVGGGFTSATRTISTDYVDFDYDGKPCVPGATTVAIDDFDDRELPLAPAVGGVGFQGTLLGPISSGTGDIWANGGQWVAGDPSDVWFGVESGVARIRHTNRGGVLIVASLISLNDETSNYTPWAIDGAGAPDFLFTQPELTVSIDFMVDQGLSYMEIAFSVGWENGDGPTLGVEPDGYFVDSGLGDFDYPMLFADGVWYTYKIQMIGTSAAAKVWERGTAEPGWASVVPIVQRPWHNESPFTGEFTLMLQSEGLLGSYTNFYIDNFVQYTDISQSDPTTISTPPGANSYGCEVATRVTATEYSTTYLIVPGSSQVTVNGVTFASGIDYTTSGTSIMFDHSVVSDAVVYVCYRGA